MNDRQKTEFVWNGMGGAALQGCDKRFNNWGFSPEAWTSKVLTSAAKAAILLD